MKPIKPPSEPPPIWFDQSLSDRINLPSNDNFHKIVQNNIHFGKDTFNNKRTEVFQFNNLYHDFDLIDIKKIDVDKEKTKLDKQLLKSINTINSKDIPEKNKSVGIKTITTKINKKIQNITNVTTCNQYILFFTDNQKQILDRWFNECTKVYNYCVNLYNIKPELFDKTYDKLKIDIFNEMYGDFDKPAPMTCSPMKFVFFVQI